MVFTIPVYVKLRVTRDVFEDSMVELEAKAKARGLQGQGHKILSSRSRLEVESSLRGPTSLGFLPRDATQRAVMARRLSVQFKSNCPTLKFNALLPPLVLVYT